MSTTHSASTLAARLAQAREADRSGRVAQAELLYLKLLKEWPDSADAATRLAQLAMQRGDAARAVQLLQAAADRRPADETLAIDLAVALVAADRSAHATLALESTVKLAPGAYTAWLLLGQIRESLADPSGALKAWYQAVTRAQRAGQWHDEAGTPAPLLEAVVHAIERVREGRRELFFGAFDEVRQQFGSAALRRVDRALTGYLRDWDATPTDPRQRPKFFFFPDLPNPPYHDPFMQPWAPRLQAAFAPIRAEAMRVVAEDRRLPNFVDVPEGVRAGHLAGAAPDPSWEAFFFYRHGERFAANHARCPQTSAVLESIELCRIADQAPEICFSVLRPGTHILPHHGVTNVRLVMHLPLVVPAHCALNLVDVGPHHWQEGRLLMFDDTFGHEAWNRSDATRIVLLMDCWNPHLSEVEKRAVRQLIETISGLQEADRAGKSARAPNG